MVTQSRMLREDREKLILDAGAKLAGKFGAKNITRKMVSDLVKTSEALISYYTGTTSEAQKRYKKQAKKLGIEEPTKEKIEAISGGMSRDLMGSQLHWQSAMPRAA